MFFTANVGCPDDTNACSFFINGHCPDIFAHGGPTADADLRLAKSASPDPALIGRLLTFAVAVANDGPFAATRVRLPETLPTDVLFVWAASTAGTCAEADAVIRCNLGALASGAGATVTIVLRPIQLGTIRTGARGALRQLEPLLVWWLTETALTLRTCPGRSAFWLVP